MLKGAQGYAEVVLKSGTSVQEELIAENTGSSPPLEGSSQAVRSVVSLSLGELLDAVGR